LARAGRWLLAVCLVAISACATPGADRYARQVEQGIALDVPHVRQEARAGCGAAALASVMAFYQGSGHAGDTLLEQYPAASPDGYTLGELREIARAQGFAGFVVPGDMAFLRSHLERGRPVIVPLQLSGRMVPLASRALGARYDHYVVVVGVDEARGTVVALDPARGPVELGVDDFAAAWAPMNQAALLVGMATVR
jgi:ABC-type bacteriocin/lantibiotic exporter with double-glycine peptidase domain